MKIGLDRRSYVLIAIVFVLSVAIIASGWVYAYLTSSEETVNKLVIGSTNSEIVEEFDPPEEILPGTVFTKNVKIKNLGPDDAYIRVKVVPTDMFMGSHCTVDWNTTDWVYESESNYWYLKNALTKDEISPSLITTVTVDADLDPALIRDFDILVYSEAYQSYGYENYQDAWNNYIRNSSGKATRNWGAAPEWGN